MSIFRVNLYNTFENIIKRKAFSAPSSNHSVYGELSELSKWENIERIKKFYFAEEFDLCGQSPMQAMIVG